MKITKRMSLKEAIRELEQWLDSGDELFEAALRVVLKKVKTK